MWDEDQGRSSYNARLGHHAAPLADICPVGEDRRTLCERKKGKSLITLFVRSVGPSCILGHNQLGKVSLTSDRTTEWSHECEKSQENSYVMREEEVIKVRCFQRRL